MYDFNYDTYVSADNSRSKQNDTFVHARTSARLFAALRGVSLSRPREFLLFTRSNELTRARRHRFRLHSTARPVVKCFAHEMRMRCEGGRGDLTVLLDDQRMRVEERSPRSKIQSRGEDNTIWPPLPFIFDISKNLPKNVWENQ